jgi:hypothetical protein
VPGSGRNRLLRWGDGRFIAADATTLASVTTDLDGNPVDLTAYQRDADRSLVDLAWSDESQDEMFFLVERDDAGAGFHTIATRVPGVATYTDDTSMTAQPVTRCTYRVRAMRPLAATAPSNEVSVMTPSTLGAAIYAGEFRDSARARRDRVILVGRWYWRTEDTRRLDARNLGVTLEIGEPGSELRVAAPAFDRRWRTVSVDGVRFRAWLPPRRASPRASFAFTLRRGVFVVVVQRFDWETAPENPVRFVLRIGGEAAEYTSIWNEPRAGVLRIGRRIRSR